MADPDSTTKKKWLFIIIFVVIVLAGLFLYFLFSGGGSTRTDTSPEDADNAIFPFGSTSSDSFLANDGDQADDSSQENSSTFIPRLEKISDAPVAGSGWVTVGTSSTATTSNQTKELIRFVRMEDGHIYQYDPTNREKEKITDTTIPQVKEAIFSPDGSKVVFRYRSDTNDIKTYLAEIRTSATSSSNYTLEGSFLPDGITNISFSPDGNSIFYSLSVDGKTRGYITPVDSSRRQEIFLSDVTSWRMRWDVAQKITAYTKPSSSSQGYVYFINTTDGSLDRITGNARALTAQANQAGEVLTTSHKGTHIHTNGDGRMQVNIKTIADFKCGWRRAVSVAYCGVPKDGGGTLDAWLQGTISYNDTLHAVVGSSGSTNQLINLSEVSGEPIDVVGLHQNNDGSYAVFENRRDDYLWLFRRNQ